MHLDQPPTRSTLVFRPRLQLPLLSIPSSLPPPSTALQPRNVLHRLRLTCLPPQKLLRSRAYITRPIPTDIEEIQLSSSDVDDPQPMGHEREEDPLAHVAEGPI